MTALKFNRFDFNGYARPIPTDKLPSGCTGKRSCTSDSVHLHLCPKLRADLVRIKENRKEFYRESSR